MRLALLLAVTLAGALTWWVVSRDGQTNAGNRPIPTPIGRGPAFTPPSRGPLAVRHASFTCTRGRLEGRYRMHLELFAEGKVVIIPAGIGVDASRRDAFGRIVGGRCWYPLRTLDPTGVVEFDRSGMTVGDVFAVWRMPLDRRRLLSFAGGRVVAFVNGAKVDGAARSIVLHDQDEIVLEINGYVPPHRSYLFPPRDE